MENKEKIIWLDGHTTTISSEEVLEKHYKVYTENCIIPEADYILKRD